MKPKTLRLPNGTRVVDKLARGMPVVYIVQMAKLAKHQDPSGRPVMGYMYACTMPNGSYATLASEQIQIYSGPVTTPVILKKSSYNLYFCWVYKLTFILFNNFLSILLFFRSSVEN